MSCSIFSWSIERIIAFGAALISLFALGVSLWQAFLQRKAIQLEIFENVFKEIRDQESLFIERYMVPLNNLERRLNNPQTDLANPIESVQIIDTFRTVNDARRLSTFSFFNTIEYLAFLINKGFVDDRHLECFFAPAVLFWYEELLRKHDEAAEKNPTKYGEFKKLYRKLREKGYQAK